MKVFQKKEYNHLYIETNGDYKKLLKEIDVFLTGSDQIWNTYNYYNPFYFLDFVHRKKIAYASSIGTTSIPDEYYSQIKSHLLKFKYIGVREESAVKVLSNLTERNDIIQVLDSTFLLTSQEWQALSCNAILESKIPSHYMLCYLIGNNKRYKEEVENIKIRLGIENVIIIPSEENPLFTINGAFLYKDAGPVEFISLIDNATYVCTDSFHASAISINLNKPFVELLRFNDLDKASQNSRIYDLLNHYHLEDRIYSSNTDSWSNDVDFDKVQRILNKDRAKSIDFLKFSIES